MKILHVFHHYRPCRGGVEKVIEELNRNLHSKGHECSVLCLNRCPKSMEKMPSTEKFKEAFVERIPFVDLRYYKFAPFSLAKLKQFDIVHIHGLGFFADYLAITKFIHKKPLVLSTHGAIFHTKSLSLLKKIYFYLWCRILLKAFCKVVAVSNADRGLFSKIAANEKIVVVENGIECKKLSAIKRQTEKNTFLYFGRLSKNKGLPELLDAFALFLQRNRNGKLLIAGKDFDALAPKLREQAERLGIEKNVSFLGEVSDSKLLELLSVAEFFASASRYEGFGIAALEAMAAGLIPLLNKIDSFERFVKNGENGFIADFSNSNNAALQMEKAAQLSSKDRQRIAANAKKFASQFDWSKKAKEYEAVYKGCIKC